MNAILAQSSKTYVPAVPCLAQGTELLGVYRDSGCVEPPSIIRRADGRMIEVSPLLHRLAANLDGARDLQALASRLSRELGRPISAASVEHLIDTKLRPLGLLADSAAAGPLPSRQSLLGLTLHGGVLPAPVVRAATTVLRPLFLPAVIAGALAALVTVDVWLVLDGGIAPGLDRLISEPTLLLLAVALAVVAGAFHELGHATASRYGGAEPGVIGAGIYLIWPVFYNDLDDSYRLDLRGHLRCDIGGVYFNVVFILVLAGMYGVTGFEPLVVVIAVQHLAILQQFLPFVRLDGYYVVSDLAGIPDLFGRIKPILSSLVPGRCPTTAVTVLKPKARAIVTAWGADHRSASDGLLDVLGHTDAFAPGCDGEVDRRSTDCTARPCAGWRGAGSRAQRSTACSAGRPSRWHRRDDGPGRGPGPRNRCPSSAGEARLELRGTQSVT